MKFTYLPTQFLQLLEVECQLPVEIPSDIIIKFLAVSRDDSYYYFEDEESVSLFDGRCTYAVSNINFIANIAKELHSMLRYYGVVFSPDDWNNLDQAIQKCLEKCESTYGAGVRDFERFEADAVIVFKSA